MIYPKDLLQSVRAHPEHRDDLHELSHDAASCQRCQWESVLTDNAEVLLMSLVQAIQERDQARLKVGELTLINEQHRKRGDEACQRLIDLGDDPPCDLCGESRYHIIHMPPPTYTPSFGPPAHLFRYTSKEARDG